MHLFSMCGAYVPLHYVVCGVQVHQVPLHAVAYTYRGLGAKENTHTGEDQALLHDRGNTTLSASHKEDHKQPIAPVNGTSYWVSNFPASVSVTDVMPYISVSSTGKFLSCVNITDVMPYLSVSFTVKFSCSVNITDPMPHFSLSLSKM